MFSNYCSEVPTFKKGQRWNWKWELNRHITGQLRLYCNGYTMKWIQARPTFSSVHLPLCISGMLAYCSFRSWLYSFVFYGIFLFHFFSVPSVWKLLLSDLCRGERGSPRDIELSPSYLDCCSNSFQGCILFQTTCLSSWTVSMFIYTCWGL